MNKNSLPFILAGLLLILAVLLAIPTTKQAVLSLLGINTAGTSSVSGSFDVFIPFIPGYFPEGFTINSVGVGMHEAPDENIYREHYASDEVFFMIIQSQGVEVPMEVSTPNLTIQGSPASLYSNPDNLGLVAEDLDLNNYDTSEAWLLTVVMREIQVQVVSNAPAEEVIRFAEELIPQQCTSTPTPEG